MLQAKNDYFYSKIKEEETAHKQVLKKMDAEFQRELYIEKSNYKKAEVLAKANEEKLNAEIERLKKLS